MLVHILSLLAFAVVSFAIQGASHFKINKAHYASLSFERKQPILWLGVSVMLFQGVVLTGLYASVIAIFPGVWGGLAFALLMGAFLGSYIALVEPSKYQVPSVAAWIRVEGTASLIQFGVYGLVLGFIHQTWAVV